MRHVAVVNAVDVKQKAKPPPLSYPSPTRRSSIPIQERSCPKNVWAEARLVLSCLFTESALLFRSTGLLFPLQLDPMGLGSVIHERFLEPRMLKCFLGCDSLLGVVHEDASEEVEELSVEVGVGWDGFLQHVSQDP